MALSELLLDYEEGDDERVRVMEEPVAVGDALAIDDDVWLVLRHQAEATRNAARFARHRARFYCRRATGITEEARQLVLEAKRVSLLARETQA